MEDDHEACNTRLHLGLGLDEHAFRKERHDQKEKPLVCLDLTFALRPREEAVNMDRKADRSTFQESDGDEEYRHKEKDSNNHRNKKEGGSKKLRLTREQSILLEESFKVHSTLNPAQKQTLAEQLNLKSRQVEVWFQNKRARTKLKQTEADCEFLKKCCESLGDENRRLKKELQELRSLQVGPSPLYIQLPKAATHRMCPSCEKVLKANNEGRTVGVAVFDAVQKNKKSQSSYDSTN
ncbi:Homeobox-leucine zipper protein HAT14 [Morella rubra]|uniref:Homeobox-leucine zipper protein HAT14 n=1 Tax=Morella rubra TaxID=262757 RepID=A0A6A1UVB3_9ROSI|nr:Homeobox-leucine zipper protein HAT14 [Morella rubra]